jgi:hypothetical protein
MHVKFPGCYAWCEHIKLTADCRYQQTKKKVVVTGVGAISAVGCGSDSFFQVPSCMFLRRICRTEVAMLCACIPLTGPGLVMHGQSCVQGKSGIARLPKWADEYPCQVRLTHQCVTSLCQPDPFLRWEVPFCTQKAGNHHLHTQITV